MAVILITHDMGVIAGRTDRVMVMYAGKIVEGATTDELFGRDAPPVLRGAARRRSRGSTRTAPSALYSIPGLPPDLDSRVTNCRFAPRCRYATDRCRQRGACRCDRRRDAPASASTVFACFNPVGSALDRRCNGSVERRGSPAVAGAARATLGAAARRASCSSRPPGEGVPGHVGRRHPAQARTRARPSPTSRSPSARARPSASSASRAAARRRSAG